MVCGQRQQSRRDLHMVRRLIAPGACHLRAGNCTVRVSEQDDAHASVAVVCIYASGAERCVCGGRLV